MQVSPVELQAWAEETGNPYPSTPAEKAAVLPAVISWKQEQLADAQASRGQNALAAPLMVAGGVGLGLAGLAAFRHFKKEGLSDPAAAGKARQVEAETRAVAQQAAAASGAPATPRPSGPHRAVEAAERYIRKRENQRYTGPRLRGDSDPTAAELETRGGVSLGSKEAREQGQYKARTEAGFHNPALAALDTPEKREAYLAGIAEAEGTDSDLFLSARDQIAAMEVQSGPGVDPLGFLQRTDKSGAEAQRFSGKDRYGTTTAAEEADNDGFLAQSRTKANTSAQAGYRSREEAEQASSKPANASVFFTDSDGSLKPYMGSKQLAYEDSGEVYYTGLRSDGSPIAKSDLTYLPNDDAEFYRRSGLIHPVLSIDDIAANAGDQRDLRYSDTEDQAIKGMLEPLSASDPRFATGVRNDGVSDNWVLGRVESGGPLVPLDLSGFQSEMEAPGVFAGGRLRRALDDYRASTGKKVPESVAITWATDLGRQHGVDAASVLRGAGFQSTAPQPERTPRSQAHALGGGSSGDALDRIYTSLGMHAGADAWELEGMVRKGDIRGAAGALAPLLPALTQANGRFLRGASQDEKLNIVAEGLTAGLQDLATITQKYPQMAEKFGIGKGAGGFGVDAYIKSYVRDWVTVRALQLDPSGQPTYQVPADALELMAFEGSRQGLNTADAVNHTIRGSRNGLEAALRIDRMVSAAQSSKEGDPNTNATSFAQTVFSMDDDDLVSTQLAKEAATDVRLSFATRRADDATKGFYDGNPSEQLVDLRIDEQGLPAFTNATLAARLKGIDRQSPDAAQRQSDVLAAQQWIAENSEQLERDREDLNRGIVQTDAGPRSIGRGFVISSGERGAFLAGNTQGMNTTYREEQFNDNNITPLDRAQDHDREATLNNQLDADLEPTGPGLADVPELAPLQSEADRTAAEYGKQKLRFKNLGPGSLGAMPAGEAAAALAAARAWRVAQDGIDAYALAHGAWSPKSWQPEAGFGFEIGASEPVRGFGPTQPVDRSVVLAAPSAIPHAAYTPPEGLVDGAVDPYDSWYRPSPQRLPGTESVTREFSLITGGFQHSAPLSGDRRVGPVADIPQVITQHLPNNVTLAPAMRVEGYPDRPPQVVFTTDWAPRPAGRQPLGTEELFALTPSQPRGAVGETPAESTLTAARHRSALEARLGGRGDTGQDAVDAALQGHRHEVDTDRAALGIPAGGGVLFGHDAGVPHPKAASEAPFRDDQQYRDHRTASENLYDAGEVSGYGRRGSTFPQAPIASAPVSVVPAAAQDALNTLRSSVERPVAQYTDQEVGDARARHIGDWISKAATPRFDKAGRQIAGWAGGDSWHGGAHLAGRADRNVTPYQPASDALVQTLAKLARRTAGAR